MTIPGPARFARKRLRSRMLKRFPFTGYLLRNESGEGLVAFALTFSFLATFLLAVVQMCLVFYTWEWVSECAREGTRYAMVHGAWCASSSTSGGSCTQSASQINTWVTTAAGGPGTSFPNLAGGTLSAATTFPDGDQIPPHRVQVVVTYTFPTVIPFVKWSHLSVSSTSVMDIIQ